MLFNSGPFFLFFLPAVLILYFLLAPRSPRGGLAWLTAASLIFYAWWDWRFLPLLLGSILGNYTIGMRTDALFRAGKGAAAKRLMIAGVVLNLALLGFFKYFEFFMRSLDGAGLDAMSAFRIILPLGISFFTFTQIAFLVDASRGRVESRDPLGYALFVTYFPHLIAGPILHHGTMMRQFQATILRAPRWENFALGLFWFFIGLIKKVLLADGVQIHVTQAFAGDLAVIGFSRAWQGALAYTFQLYFDFSGYCDMAIGISLMLGVAIPLNFNSPYKARSIIEFWRRWHISLSDFLRDYLYIPLGGNRKGEPRRYANILITMLLGGLWHGAGWTFLLWGGLHGLYLLVNHAWRRLTKTEAEASSPKGGSVLSPALSLIAGLAGTALTFLAVAAAWVPFVAPSLRDTGHIWKAMAGFRGFTLPEGWGASFTESFPLDAGGWPFGAWLLLCLGVVFLLPNSHQLSGRLGTWLEALPEARRKSAAAFLTGVLFLLCVFLVMASSSRGFSEFLYFDF